MTAVRNIDYWGLVTRSARVAWSNKFLWFFGFFAAGGGGGNYGSVGEHGAAEIKDFFLSHIEVLVLIVMGLVLLWLVFLVLGLISKGALFSCIRRADAGEKIKFEEGWRAGLKAFWGLLGIGLLALLAFLIVSGVCTLAVVLPLIGGAPGVAVAIFIGAILFIPYIVFLFLLAFTVIYAERHYVIAGGGVADALAFGWNLTKSYFWQSLLMWLVSFASNVAFAIAIIVSLLAMAIPFILIGLASPVVGLILGIPVGIVALILATSAFSTYAHSLWTLMYGELTGPAVAGAGGSVAPVDPESRIVPEMPRHLYGHGPERSVASDAREDAGADAAAEAGGEGGSGDVPPDRPDEPEGAGG
jgi:hypothetical protein